MSKKGIRGVLLAGVVFIILCIIFLKPVPPVTDENRIEVMGEVVNLWEGSSYDIVFRLKNNNHNYYINRGVESGLEVGALYNQLVGNEVTLTYADYWTPLDPTSSTHHVAQLEYNGEILYTEID